MAVDTTSKQNFYERRKSALEKERSSFEPHWKELVQYISPRKGRFFIGDQNRGEKRYQSIINSCATQALKVSRAGLMSGIMQPSRPWFNLETEDAALMSMQEVRVWLDVVRAKMLGIYNRSNLYNVAPIMLADLLLFATGSMCQLEDDKDVVRFYHQPIGSYLIAQDNKYNVNTHIREFQMTVDQIVSEYGVENCSVRIADLYKKGDIDSWVTVCHYVGPNKNYLPELTNSKYKKFASITWESGCNEKDKYLRESGFDEFPYYVPRWDLTGEDSWGTDCPGMVALGDVKQLQLEEKRKAQAIDKMVNPPLKGPASLKSATVSSLPGGLTIYDQDLTKEGLGPIYQVDPRITELMNDMKMVEGRIKEAFFIDLFFAITQMDGIQPRNELELTQRNQERLLQLGPVLERLHNDFLSNMVERTFNIMARKGLLPEAPGVLEGQPLAVKFVSSLAMAQRSSQINAINDMRLFVTEMASGGFPTAVDKFNADQAIDEFSLITGVPAIIIRSDEEVVGIRSKRDQAMAQEQQQEQMAQLSQQIVTNTRK